MHEDKFRVHIAKMTCADCGEAVPPEQRGWECNKCKRWPLCDDCMNFNHYKGGMPMDNDKRCPFFKRREA